MDHQWKVVVQDMPALDPNASRGRQDRIAEELGSLVDLQQEAASDRREGKNENKLPSEIFGGQMEIFMRLCRVGREESPGVWGLGSGVWSLKSQ